MQYNCYIDKEVKYLFSGLKNVSAVLLFSYYICYNYKGLKDFGKYSCKINFQRLQESMSKRSEVLDRDAEYIKTLKVARLPGYLTVQMVRFQFKQKDAINAKILKDIKFPMMLDVHDLCTSELQNKLLPMRSKFKDYEDAIVEDATKIKGDLF